MKSKPDTGNNGSFRYGKPWQGLLQKRKPSASPRSLYSLPGKAGTGDFTSLRMGVGLYLTFLIQGPSSAPCPAVMEWATQIMCTLIKSSIEVGGKESGKRPSRFNLSWGRRDKNLVNLIERKRQNKTKWKNYGHCSYLICMSARTLPHSWVLCDRYLKWQLIPMLLFSRSFLCPLLSIVYWFTVHLFPSEGKF